MTTLTITKERGGRTAPTTMTEVAPSQAMLPAELASFAPELSINHVQLADLLSAFLAHEQCGAHLYKTVAGLTQNPMLQGKYNEFLEETEHHVDVLEQLIRTLGGDPAYVSPTARLVHAMDAKMIEAVVLAAGSADILPLEAAMLEAVMLAETKDAANWALLGGIAEDLDDSDTKDAILDAVEDVEPDENDHLTWATSTWQSMQSLQVGSAVAMTAIELGERLVGKISDRLT